MTNHILCQMNNDFSCECKEEQRKALEEKKSLVGESVNQSPLFMSSGSNYNWSNTSATIDGTINLATNNGSNSSSLINSHELVSEFFDDGEVEDNDEIELEEMEE